MNKIQQISNLPSQLDTLQSTKTDMVISVNEPAPPAKTSFHKTYFNSNPNDLATATGSTPDCDHTGDFRFFSAS